MVSASLKELFIPTEISQEEDTAEDSVIGLHFKYGQKSYCTPINDVKEIIDFPRVIPFPVSADKALGVFNLRGNIIPIMDPEGHLIKIQEMHRSKASTIFERMKLRLIVFEIAPEMVVALPAQEVGKCEVSPEEAESSTNFIRINGIPHEKFDIRSLIGGGNL